MLLEASVGGSIEIVRVQPAYRWLLWVVERMQNRLCCMYADDSVMFSAVVLLYSSTLPAWWCQTMKKKQKKAEKRHLVSWHILSKKENGITEGRVYQKLLLVLESDDTVCPIHYWDHMQVFLTSSPPGATKMLKQTRLCKKRNKLIWNMYWSFILPNLKMF